MNDAMQDLKTNLKNILIVEDEKDMQELYRMYFSHYRDRYRIDIEGKGGTALNKLKAKKFDLIVLDIVMEPMSGDSFLYYARQDRRTAKTPVLVVSVLDADILENLKKLDHVDFLQKPVAQKQFIEKIEEMLNRPDSE